MRAKRSAEGKQAAHRYRAEAFESAFRDEEKLLNPIRRRPLRSRVFRRKKSSEERKAKKNNERKAPGAFAYAPEASLLLRRKD